VSTHEADLFSVLEKIGQPAETSDEVPATLDADEGSAHPETAPRPDPLQSSTASLIIGQENQAPLTSRNLFVHFDTHPVVYDILLLKKYNEDWFKWEHETLWHTIMQDFRVPSISEHAKSKIQAVRTLHINEWFWTKWEITVWVTQALNNNLPDFQVIQKPSISQLFSAVDISSMVRDDEKFNLEVSSFVAACLIDDSIFYAPYPLEFCQKELTAFLEQSNIPEISQRTERVKNKFREIVSQHGELKETEEDIQVARLLVARDYMLSRRQQMRDQLKVLDHES